MAPRSCRASRTAVGQRFGADDTEHVSGSACRPVRADSASDYSARHCSGREIPQAAVVGTRLEPASTTFMLCRFRGSVSGVLRRHRCPCDAGYCGPDAFGSLRPSERGRLSRMTRSSPRADAQHWCCNGTAGQIGQHGRCSNWYSLPEPARASRLRPWQGPTGLG